MIMGLIIGFNNNHNYYYNYKHLFLQMKNIRVKQKDPQNVTANE